MDMKQGTLNLKFKVYQYDPKTADEDFLKEQFGIYASDYDIDWNSEEQKVKPRVNTANLGRIFLEKGDYLLYADEEDPDTALTIKLLGYIDPILVAKNSWDNFNEDILDLETLIEDGIFKMDKD